jgi:AAA domain
MSEQFDGYEDIKRNWTGRGEQDRERVVPGLGEWDAGQDDYVIAPREWLLGPVFCKGFVSGLVAPGAAGKTAVRILQYLSCATGRPLSGEHVFRRCRVLLLSLEDDQDEVRRRVKAAMIRHNIKAQDIAGWLYLATPRDLLLAEMKDGTVQAGELETALRRTIKEREIDLVGIDPLVKAHGVEENDNGAMDFVAGRLALLAMQTRCAFDTSHHTSKGPQMPGDANKARGASAYVNALRLVYSLTVMSPEEAQTFGVPEKERRSLIRIDSAKVNIAPPSGEAQWFRLVGINLANATDAYPHGDTVQTVERWTPPDTWAGLSTDALNAALTAIEAGLPNGQRFSPANKAGNRSAWPIVQKHCPNKPEAQCRDIIRTWVKNGVLFEESYDDPVVRKPRAGLRVNATKRPS